MELTNHIYLEEFHSSNNNIASISQNIGNSIKLKLLNVYACPIKEIPKDIEKLINLKYFYFNGNFGGGIIDIHTIPKNILKCIHLKGISCIYKNKDLILKLLANESYHKQYFCTFKELFLKVYQRIINHPQKNKLFEKLKEDDAKLLTGRLLRLANVLTNSCKDIQIDISNNSIIYNIISKVINKYGYIDDKVKDEMSLELRKELFEDNIIYTWIYSIKNIKKLI